jgi:hypothetical protein
MMMVDLRQRQVFCQRDGFYATDNFIFISNPTSPQPREIGHLLGTGSDPPTNWLMMLVRLLSPGMLLAPGITLKSRIFPVLKSVPTTPPGTTASIASRTGQSASVSIGKPNVAPVLLLSANLIKLGAGFRQHTLP